MSFNQSRSDKSETQYRRTGRSGSFNQHRGSSSGAYGRGSGGPAPSPSIPPNRSYKKSNNNAQGAQSRAPSGPAVNSSSENSALVPRCVQNGAHVQPQIHGAPDAPVFVPVAKQAEPSSAPRSSRGVPKAPTSQNAPVISYASATASTPTKAPGDGSKPFLQFGSISPGFVNGMQIPARTSSAPPNLDEQKRDQVRQEPYRAAPALPTPVPKQQVPRRDPVASAQPVAPETQQPPKVKKDVPTPPAGHTQKPSSIPMGGISIPIQYHQSPVSMPYGSNQQIPQQNVGANSIQIQMPLSLPIGSSPQVQQPMFIAGLQPIQMSHQGIIHQGQNMSFTPQMGQLPNQIGNLGIGIGPQYPQQQAGKFAPPRKTPVKITNPKTHEEVRFDKRADGYGDGGMVGLRPHPNVPPQSQTIPPYGAPHQMNYYQASYANNMYYPNPSSLPLTSGQVPPNSHTQAGRYNYSGTGSHNVKIMNPSALNKPGTHVHGILEPPNVEHARDVQTSGTTHVTVRPAAGSREKVEPPSVEVHKPAVLSAHTSSSHSSITDKSLQQLKSGSDSVATGSSMVIDQPAGMVTAVQVEGHVPSSTVLSKSEPTPTNADIKKKEPPSNSSSTEDQSVKKGLSQSQHQVGGPTAESAVAMAISSSATCEDVPYATQELVATTPDVSVSKTETILESSASVSTENSGIPASADTSVPKLDVLEGAEQGNELSEGPNEDLIKPKVSSELNSLQSVLVEGQDGQVLQQEDTSTSSVIPSLETTSTVDEPVQSHCITPNTQDEDIEDSSIDKSSSVDVFLSKGDISDDSVIKSTKIIQDSLPPLAAETMQEGEQVGTTESIGTDTDSATGAAVSVSVPAGSKDKILPELTRSKSSNAKGKKKRKEFLQKADAAGSSDLYLAYKSPEEIKESLAAAEVAESSSLDLQQDETDVTGEDDTENKAEPEDWEVAADTKSKLETENDGVAQGGAVLDKDGGVKKYSRDFLLKFADQCTNVPEHFEITADIVEILRNPNASSPHIIDRSPAPSPGRGSDRSVPRLDRRNSGVTEDDRWNKISGPFPPKLDTNFGHNPGFRPVQGGNFGVMRNMRGQGQSPFGYAGGILTGPMQSMGPQGGMYRNSPDGDKWQRATHFQQKGLIPSPHTPLVTMHKTERRYEVGKVTDEEEAKQRQLKAILNKLTPQNFEKLFEQVKAVNIDEARTLRGVIAQIFDKALTEPTFCEMYANFCFYLSGDLPDFIEDDQKVTFKRLLLNKCQEEFERGEREQEEANKADEEGEVKQSAEEREEKRVNARRRMLGNIRLIGELFKKKMLTERIMHECIKKLLGQHQTPDEEDIEALCKLMSTIGQSIDHSKAKEHMDAYFEGMKTLSNNMTLSSRVRFMLKDSIDLRRNNWQQRRKVEGPKKIEEVHRDAAQERQAQTSRLSGRGSAINQSGRRGGQMDFNQRGPSIIASPGSQMGSFRSIPSQSRGFGSQDVRTDERQTYDPRPLSMSLTQRPGDEAITLGPQGGLARGMSSRGPVSVSPSSLADISPVGGEARRLNGYSSASDRGHNPREDSIPGSVPERGQAAFDQSSAQERNVCGVRDLRPPSRGEAQTSSSTPAGSLLSEEELRAKSKTAIKEYYSARDIGEIALCIKELNSPSFHPTMVSIWVGESFEGKAAERDMLASLLVKLTTSNDASLSPSHLVQGFASVLEMLEDTVTDAPMAPQYLGRMFAKVITENVVPLEEIGRLIREGGEEPGRLLISGLAGDVIGSLLEIIHSEKGDEVLNALIKGSSLQFETFRPPNPMTSKTLEKFILFSEAHCKPR